MEVGVARLLSLEDELAPPRRLLALERVGHLEAVDARGLAPGAHLRERRVSVRLAFCGALQPGVEAEDRGVQVVHLPQRAPAAAPLAHGDDRRDDGRRASRHRGDAPAG